MNEQTVAEKKKNSPPRGAGAAEKSSRRYPPEFRLRAVRMCVDEGRTQAEVAGLLHVSPKTVSRWAQEGKLPFLHVSHENPRAKGLYERMGYRLRRDIGFWSLRRG